MSSLTPETWQEIERVFFAALDLERAERTGFLDETCAGREDVRAEVEAMLAAHDEHHGLEVEGLLLADGTPEAGGLAGSRVGVYFLERLLGRGGMGEVYVATRADEQYRQTVAFKVVRPGFQSPELVERFRVERQILARLNHANIATLLDGGVTDDGRPYLVMEFVEGTPITEYCDRHRLSVVERVKLFATVCGAVQFAHANLVVHRDIKPSNLLVTADGESRLLDFGIAKLLDPADLDLPASATRPEVRLLTPERAAPEQLRGEPVTTATDVYSLGILLYELLTGQLPFHFESDRTPDIERVVTSREPMRPSALFTSSGRRRSGGDGSNETDGGTLNLEQICVNRSVRPERLRRLLRGDLERIVLMALRKDPERRYASAGQLAEDVGRFLRKEPVLARADTLWYRTARFVRRNTAVTAAGAIAVGLLLAFAMTATFQARSVARERDLAQAERDRAQEAVQMLVDLFETSDPIKGAGGDQVPVGEFLAKAESRVDELDAQPHAQARLLHVLGSISFKRSQYERAKTILERALALQRSVSGEDAAAAAIYRDLALVASARGDPDVLPLYEHSLAWQRRLHGDVHADVAQALQDLGMALSMPAGRAHLEEALAIRRRLSKGPDLGTADSLNALAIHLGADGERGRAAELWRESHSILIELRGETHPHTMTVLGNLAATLDDLEDQSAVFRRLLELRIEVFGRDSAEAALSWNNLGVSLVRQGRYAEAREALGNALDVWTSLVGNEHPQVANTARNLGMCFHFERRYEEALVHLERAVAIYLQLAGAEDRATAYLNAQLAVVRLYLGRSQEALSGLDDAVAVLRRTTPQHGHHYLGDALIWLGMARLAASEHESAEASLREALEIRSGLEPFDPRKIAEARATLGLVLAAQRRFDEAEPLLREGREGVEGWALAHPVLLDQLDAALGAL